MDRIPAGLLRVAAAYLALVFAVVLAARLGLYPAANETYPGDPVFAHPYRVSMAATLAVLAALLGAGCAVAGSRLRSRFLGLAGLLAGGVLTGLLLSIAPWILYPQDQYPVSFLWVMLGAPLGLATWGAVAVFLGASPGEGSLAA